MYKTTKTYTHAQGLSVCFRQWRATHSHCQYLHGYAIQVEITFRTYELDDRGWVVDFGDMDDIKEWLRQTFDHKTVVADDDPELLEFSKLSQLGVADVVILPHVGCEAFAKHIFDYVAGWVKPGQKIRSSLEVESVVVKEHGGNSAIYCV